MVQGGAPDSASAKTPQIHRGFTRASVKPSVNPCRSTAPVQNLDDCVFFKNFLKIVVNFLIFFFF
jgi:hypothetical protein